MTTAHNTILTNLAQILGTPYPYVIQKVHKSRQQRLQQRKHLNPTHHSITRFSQLLFNLQLLNTERIRHLIQRFQHIHTNTPTTHNVCSFKNGPQKV